MSTRSHKKKLPVTQELQFSCNSKKRVENSWIVMINDSLFESKSFTFITLPHPATGSPSKYCLDVGTIKMYEVVTFSEPYRSWFIGETVKSDGNIMMVTPINPIFLVLPKLRELCNNRAIPLEDLLADKGFDNMISFMSKLEDVADLKEAGDIKAYKYNEKKTLVWLEKRIRKLASVLREKNIHVTSGAVSATFISSNVTNDNVDEEFYLKYACGIVSEYLEDDLLQSLENHMNFTSDLVEYIGGKRKTEEVEENDTNIKRLKLEVNDEDNNKFNLNTSLEVKKQKPLSAKEKARQKAASGTKTISAFFTKKS